jgi:putative ABC transport system ATP-binding protein
VNVCDETNRQAAPAHVVSLRNVSKHFSVGGQVVQALRNATLDIDEGELLGIYGPSGSGKTTLLMQAGLVEAPTAGEIYYRGERASTPSSTIQELRQMRKVAVGFMFQRPNLVPFLNAQENVSLSLYLRGFSAREARHRAMQLLAEFGIAERLGSYPRHLSGGEQQRVALARSLAGQPLVLFADEPTAALDSTRGEQVLRLFRTMADRGTAVCLITHDQRWLPLCDREIEMLDGEIIEMRRRRAHW